MAYLPEWLNYLDENGVDWDSYDEHLRLRRINNEWRAMLLARAGVVGLLAFLMWWI